MRDNKLELHDSPHLPQVCIYVHLCQRNLNSKSEILKRKLQYVQMFRARRTLSTSP